MYAPPDVELQEFWRNWEHDTLYWVRHDAPTIVVALVVAFVLLQLLHLLTNRLQLFAEHEPPPASRRRMQIRTIATIVNSFGMAIVLFIAGLQILKALHFDIGPLRSEEHTSELQSH